MSAVIAAVAAFSCQKTDDLVGAAGKDATMVTLTVNVPSANTKATTETEKVSVGAEVDVLYYEVWNADTTRKLFPKNPGELASVPVSGNTASIELSLVSAQKYTFILWAQNEDCGAYNVSDLTKVGIDYSVITDNGNEDAFDAFYKVERVEVLPSKTYPPIVLRRPFAQLNFGASVMNTDLGPIELGNTYVKVARLSKVFDTLTGKGDIAAENIVTDVIFEAAGRVSDTEGAEAVTLNTNNIDYAWISMNYMLMAEESDAVDVTATFDIVGIGSVSHFITNVSIMKNFRTNIVGDLFTSDAVLEILVDPAFDPTGDILVTAPQL